MFYYSSIQQPLTIQVATTQLVKPLKIFTKNAVYRNGAGVNNNYRIHLFLASVLLSLIN
jgi:hypothetical protein